MTPRPMPKRPFRPFKPTGSGPNEINRKDVGWSFLEAFSGATGIEVIGREFVDSLPMLAMSVPVEIVTWIAIIAFAMIFIGRLMRRKRTDNRANEE